MELEFPKHPFRTHGGAAVPHHQKHLEHPLGHMPSPPAGRTAHAAAYRRALCPHGEERGPRVRGHRGGRQRRLCVRPGARLCLRHGGGHHPGDAHRRPDDHGGGHRFGRAYGKDPNIYPPLPSIPKRSWRRPPVLRPGGPGRRGLSRPCKAERARGQGAGHPHRQRGGVRALCHLRPPGGPGERPERAGGRLQGKGDPRRVPGAHRCGGQQARCHPEAAGDRRQQGA